MNAGRREQCASTALRSALSKKLRLREGGVRSHTRRPCGRTSAGGRRGKISASRPRGYARDGVITRAAWRNQLLIVTVMPADVVVFPAASLAVAVTVYVPFDTPCESHVSVNFVSGDWVVTSAPMF